jgi:DNA-binding NtrC family response regulator
MERATSRVAQRQAVIARTHTDYSRPVPVSAHRAFPASTGFSAPSREALARAAGWSLQRIAGSRPQADNGRSSWLTSRVQEDNLPPPAESTSSTQSLSRPRGLVFERLRVRVCRGKDLGLERESAATEFSVGTGESNDLRLSDPTVSRHHCSVRATSNGLLLRDLESTNGTFVAGCRVESLYLAKITEVEIGGTLLRFELLHDQISEALSDSERFGPILGAGPAMRRIFEILSRVAASDATVLLEGETGTGKGLIAGAIHRASPRARGPLVVVDCSAIPPTLVEAELFGHAKGAFTGAHAARAGAFEAASSGTVFLDEIGELPLEVQPKLLRALEERTIKRLGETETRKLDIRVIAATNRDLRRQVNAGSFRSDLFYRLDVVRVRVPPLRERREDIPLLATHFYRQLAKDPTKSPPAELLGTLLRQDWPGNVRQLRSAVERALLMEDLELWQKLCGFDVEAAPEPESERDPALSFREAKERTIARWEREYLKKLIASTNGNVSAAARVARMDRNHLRELLVKHESPGTD